MSKPENSGSNVKQKVRKDANNREVFCLIRSIRRMKRLTVKVVVP